MAPRRPPPPGFVGLLGLAIVLVAGLAISAAGRPLELDQLIHGFFATHRSGWADTSAAVLNVVGNTLSSAILAAVLVVVFLVARRWRTAAVVGLSLVLASTASSLVKALFLRARPDDALLDLASGAFPSGHVAMAAALAVALALAFPHWWSWALAGGWVLVMAIGRTYLLVHWLSDVVGGAVLGASVALLVHSGVARLSTAKAAVG
jgi:membrane-associated phospholipid phosphatase